MGLVLSGAGLTRTGLRRAGLRRAGPTRVSLIRGQPNKGAAVGNIVFPTAFLFAIAFLLACGLHEDVVYTKARTAVEPFVVH
ncbi:hypothetical protein GCM10027580_13910 [Corynebacterium faecale]